MSGFLGFMLGSLITYEIFVRRPANSPVEIFKQKVVGATIEEMKKENGKPLEVFNKGLQ